ncbi:hypothetical protein [Curvivirga sp.]|uniref:hypothetical protein n=1 Tax=Curvivirga sp. TaxID=2856848 RepID=UPI003B59F070
MSKDLKVLIVITIICLVIACWIYCQSEVSDNGWTALGWGLLIVPLIGLWGLAIGGYSGWVVIRDGISVSTIPYALISGGIILFSCTMLFNIIWQNQVENSARHFVDRFERTTRLQERLILISEIQSKLEKPDFAFVEQLAFILSPPHIEETQPVQIPEAERRKILKFVIREGLVPSPYVLNIFAVNNADIFMAQLLIQKRKEMKKWVGEDEFVSIAKKINKAELTPLIPQYSFDLALKNLPYCDEKLDALGEKELELAQLLWAEGKQELRTLTKEEEKKLFRSGCK